MFLLSLIATYQVCTVSLKAGLDTYKAVEPTPTASARASLWLSARLTAGVRHFTSKDGSYALRLCHTRAAVACHKASSDGPHRVHSKPWCAGAALYAHRRELRTHMLRKGATMSDAADQIRNLIFAYAEAVDRGNF